MIEDRIIEILSDINDEIVTYEGNNLLKDRIIDSLQITNIVADLECEFDIDIDASYIDEENFATKESIISMVNKLLSK